MTDQMAKAQAERDSACEEAARLRGQVEILQAQANRQARASAPRQVPPAPRERVKKQA